MLLAAVLAQRIGGPRAGLCAGLVVALYPPLLANDTITLTEPLALLLVLGIALLMDDAHWLWAAALAGALVLTRPNAYLVVALVVFVAFRRAGTKTAVVATAIALAVVAYMVPLRGFPRSEKAGGAVAASGAIPAGAPHMREKS